VAVGALVVLLALIVLLAVGLPSASGPHSAPRSSATAGRTSPLVPTWRGDGRAVTLAFGGDVHFEGPLGDDLSSDPATALDGVSALTRGADLSMASLDSALSNNGCAAAVSKPYVFSSPLSAITALHDAGIGVVSQANNHAMDCGSGALAPALDAADAAGVQVVGIGQSAASAYAPYRRTIDGERIAVLAATQLFDPEETASTAATATTAGVASAQAPAALLAAVEATRRSTDTLVVYLEWGSDGSACPGTAQSSLATALVRAGADIVVGAGSHVPMGAGYRGSAFVDYGLGNLAFYDAKPPESDSGSLIVTVTGRHVDRTAWRPAVLVSGQPRSQSGATADAAVAHWSGLRSCAGLTAARGASVASPGTERAVPAPPGSPAGGAPSSTSTTSPSSSLSTTGPTTPAPTDNAGQPLTAPSSSTTTAPSATTGAP
jgi:poly-gamma-glutamate synthesis protein (capsule biosynthesis protein)